MYALLDVQPDKEWLTERGYTRYGQRAGWGYSESDREGIRQQYLYEQAMGREVNNLYLSGPAALQWNYRTTGRKPPGGSWKDFFRAFTNGAKAPRKKPAELAPLERLSKAARARKRANNEWKRAIQAGRENHTLAELAAAAGISRQRVSQILSA